MHSFFRKNFWAKDLKILWHYLQVVLPEWMVLEFFLRKICHYPQRKPSGKQKHFSIFLKFFWAKTQHPKILKSMKNAISIFKNFRRRNTFWIDCQRRRIWPYKKLGKTNLRKAYHLQMSLKIKSIFPELLSYEKYDGLPIIHDLYYFKIFW